MTIIEDRPTTTVAGMVDATLLRAVAIAASTDQTRPALTCVAFTPDGADGFELQATDSHIAIWTGDVPRETSLLVDAKALVAAIRGVKGWPVAISFEDGRCTVHAGDSSTSLPTTDASYPRLASVIPDETVALETIGLSTVTMTKVVAVAKLVGPGMALTFAGPGKPIRVRFTAEDRLSAVAMPFRLS